MSHGGGEHENGTNHTENEKHASKNVPPIVEGVAVVSENENVDLPTDKNTSTTGHGRTVKVSYCSSVVHGSNTIARLRSVELVESSNPHGVSYTHPFESKKKNDPDTATNIALYTAPIEVESKVSKKLATTSDPVLPFGGVDISAVVSSGPKTTNGRGTFLKPMVKVVGEVTGRVVDETTR